MHYLIWLRLGKQSLALGDWRKIIAGVLQASILGPLLLNIFLMISFSFKETPVLVNVQTIALCAYNKNLETVICNIRQKFSILSNWFYDNNMVVNPGQCHFMLFGVKENKQFDLMSNYITLKHSSHEKKN